MTQVEVPLPLDHSGHRLDNVAKNNWEGIAIARHWRARG